MENQDSSLNHYKKQLDALKTLLIALAVLLAFSTFSFVVSIIIKSGQKLDFKDYLNLIVMTISFLSFVVLLVIYIKNKRKK